MRSTNISARECTTCFKVKNLNEFYSKGDRLDSSCKECVKIRKRISRSEKSAFNQPLTNYGEILQKPVKIEIDKEQLRDFHAIRNNLTSFFHLAFDLRKECSRKALKTLESNYEVK